MPMPVAIRPVTSVIGAEISGVDLREPLAAAEVPRAQAPEFDAKLLDELKTELGFTPGQPLTTSRHRELRDADRSASTGRWIVLLVAAAVLVAALGLLVAVGGRREAAPEPLRRQNFH